MKIRRLEIKNIASIEEALIDFDKKPLSDTDLFLITGTTGAGKTTLLDAICLALYNTTPRISKGRKENFDVNRDGLTERDPRNILRQNTGYGYSRLLFTGNNGHEYWAEWSVERGSRRKVESNLSRAVWKITDLDTGISAAGDKTETYKEVRDVIHEAVGLDFEQFGRTTMLAQGDFTEFLKSDEADKAAILEKISGSEIYRRIGIMIYKKADEAKRLLEAEAAKHAQITILSDEERQKTEAELETAAAESAAIQQKVNELNACINWLKEKDRIGAKAQTAAAQLVKAVEITSSEEFRSRSLRARQWHETIDVRARMKEAADYGLKLRAASEALEVLKRQFHEVLCGREAEKEALEAYLSRKEALEEHINAQSAYADAYGSYQTIIAHIKSLTAEKDEASAKRIRLQDSMQTKLPEAERLHEASRAAEKSAADDYKAVEEQLNEISARIAALKLPDLRKEKEFLKEVEGMKRDMADSAAKIATASDAISKQEAAAESYKAEERKEKLELARLKAEHERRRQTVDRFAKEMRSHLNLHVGDEDNLCPVCGHLVSTPVNDALIDDEYRKIREEYETQEKKAASASDMVNKTDALIKVERNNLETLQKEHHRHCMKLTDATSSRKDAQELLQCSLEELAVRIEELAARISEGEKIEKEQKEQQKKHDSLLLKKHQAEKESEKTRNAVESIRSEIQRLADELKKKEGRINELSATISAALEATAWKNDWKSAPDAFAGELEEKARSYNADMDALAKAISGIERTSAGISVIDSALNDISALMPEWGRPSAKACRMNDLQTLCVRLNANVKMQKHALTSAESEYSRAKAEVETFLAANPAYTSEILETLCHISQSEYERETLYINKVSSDADSFKREHELAEQELQAHLESKPDCLDDIMTVDTLTTDKEEHEKRRDECNQLMGELRPKLLADDEARILKQDTRKLDELGAICAKWQGFCKYYGDSEGKKLSKIAQSFVLSSLLDAANHHLQNVAPRYRLLVNPGSLNLKLEDKYHGYSTRSTNSISGGESFLVSLALALALADFGQHLGVSTLFIDEGFGTLSGEPLQNAINTLKSLHSKAGRQVGIISHREEIRENIPVQIKVNLAEGKSSSTVEVTDK